jgi:hypothetical protein
MGRPGWREAHRHMEVHGEIDELELDIFTDGLNQQVYEIGNFISPRVASSRATEGAKPSTPASTSPPPPLLSVIPRNGRQDHTPLVKGTAGLRRLWPWQMAGGQCMAV